ncbi:MAG: phenylalanine--tRNA ligase subunit alpha [Methanomassiliicoccaceae archaeon]|jgi:phenylalanyl-tRNA synthetase alpha chain|nr:phenylalanine--tRNA ligase subunit alpha [Methanomassiliicoccaceae archaeon]
MDKSEIYDGLSFNEKRLLLSLDGAGKCSPADLISSGRFDLEVEVMGAASWLSAKGLAIIDECSSRSFVLADRGAVTNGLPERRALNAIHSAGGSMELSALAEALPGGEDKIAIGWLKRKGLADIQKGEQKTISLTKDGKDILKKRMKDEDLLKRMSEGAVQEGDADPAVIKDLKGRQGIIEEKITTNRSISLTELGKEMIRMGIELKDETAQLTVEMLQSGKWKDAEFRRYDVQTFAPSVAPAKKHPLSRLADEIRNIFVQMGFTEIDEEYVQPAFWNMDVLFTPQDHPARDLQDTFYLKDPERIRIDDRKLIKKVKDIHETGGDTGSTGWGGTWSLEKAEQALLRTHTTVNTIKHLSKNPDPPVKVFSLSRIFRNESIDATHLPEFTQIEGIIVDEKANFDMLVSLVKRFYGMMGFDKIRIRPAYFPYTEPSLEVEVFFNGRWMELGGAGIFRPEVVSPFGVKHPVLAWGFGFERLAMLKWNIRDIRDLYVSDIDLLKKNTIFSSRP